MNFLYISMKYLRKRNKFFMSFSNMLSLAGIIISVFSILVVSSVMNGFRKNMISNITEAKSEIKIFKEDYSNIQKDSNILKKIKSISGIEAVSEISEAELILQNNNMILSSNCVGVNFKNHKKVTSVFDNLAIGDVEKLGDNEIILGFDLALNLGLTVGEFLTISSPVAKRITPFGKLPKIKRMKVVGIINSKYPEYNRIFSFINLNSMQYLLNMKKNEFKSFVASTNSLKKSMKISESVQKKIGASFNVMHWSEFESNLFVSMKIEKIIMYIVLFLMTLLASFNMTGNFIRLVVEKKSEIGILKVLGVSEKQMRSIFVSIGLIIGFLGIFIGMISALILLLLQIKFQLITIPLPGLFMNQIPIDISILDFVLVFLIVSISAFLSTLYPIRKTGEIDPIKIIRENEE